MIADRKLFGSGQRIGSIHMRHNSRLARLRHVITMTKTARSACKLPTGCRSLQHTPCGDDGFARAVAAVPVKLIAVAKRPGDPSRLDRVAKFFKVNLLAFVPHLGDMAR